MERISAITYCALLGVTLVIKRALNICTGYAAFSMDM